MTGSHLCSHKNRGGIGKACKETDHQAFQCTEYRQRRDRLLRLPAKDYVDAHVSEPDQKLVHDDGKAFPKIDPDKGKAKTEMPFYGEQIGMPALFRKEDHQQDSHSLGNDRGQCSAADSHGRKTEMPEDQDIV